MEAVENDRMRKVGNKSSARNGPLIVINANFERRDVGLVEKSATENTRLETTGWIFKIRASGAISDVDVIIFALKLGILGQALNGFSLEKETM